MNVAALGSWLATRLQEPSTWAGLSGLAAVFGWTLTPGITQNISVAGVAVGSVLATILKEKTST